MQLPLIPQRRMAQTNYPIRVGSFAYSFMVLVALLLERNVTLGLWQLVLPVVAFLLYPHFAFLHTRIARDSTRAELANLLIDTVLLGMIAAQTGLALWVTFVFALAIGVNNAVCGGARQAMIAFLLFFGSALAWYIVLRPGFRPDTSVLVTALCAAGIAAYVSAVGLVVHWQNAHLVKNRDALRRREDQFRFIAEHAAEFVAVLDAKGCIRYTSGAFLERFDPNVIGVGSHWTGLIDPSQRGRAWEFLMSSLKSGVSRRISLDFVTSGGELLRLETAANIMQDIDGEGPRVLIISRSRSQAEEGMATAVATGIFERHAAYGLLITSVLGRVEFASPRMAEISGYAPASLIGKTIGEIAEAIPASDSLMDDVWQSMETTGVCNCKVVVIHKSGQLKLAWANVVQLSGSDASMLRYAWTIVEDHALAAAWKQPA